MLKQRLITAAILIPSLIASVVWLPGNYFALLIGIFVVIGAWEWTRFMRLAALYARVFYVAVTASALWACWYFVIAYPERVHLLLWLALLWWLCAIGLVISYPRFESLSKKTIISGIIGWLVLIPAWLAVVALHNNFEQGIQLVLFLLLLIAIADSGAYFGGRKWGKNKLAPRVSPGKSWEGVITGLLCVAALSFGFAWAIKVHAQGWYHIGVFISISLLTAVFSVFGDLSESMFKRQVGLKDSGAILPGHGGVLDRIDSITAAAPVFVLCLLSFLGIRAV